MFPVHLPFTHYVITNFLFRGPQLGLLNRTARGLYYFNMFCAKPKTKKIQRTFYTKVAYETIIDGNILGAATRRLRSVTKTHVRESAPGNEQKTVPVPDSSLS